MDEELAENQTVENTETQVTQETEQSAEPNQQTETTSESAPEETNSVQERINKVISDKHAERARADKLQVEIDQLKSTNTTSNDSASNSDQAPTLEQYDWDDDKYQQALIEHRVKSQVDSQMRSIDENRQKRETESTNIQLQNDFNKKVELFAKSNADYVDVIRTMPVLPPDTERAIMSLDNGAGVAYYLGKNLDVADKIMGMNPMSAAIEIGRISSRLSNNSQKTTATTAPNPVSTVNSGGQVSKDIGDPNTSSEDWFRENM